MRAKVALVESGLLCCRIGCAVVIYLNYPGLILFVCVYLIDSMLLTLLSYIDVLGGRQQGLGEC